MDNLNDLKIKEKILKFLKKQELDVTVPTLCNAVDVSKPTMFKYLAVLVESGKVKRRIAGRSALYRLKGGRSGESKN